MSNVSFCRLLGDSQTLVSGSKARIYVTGCSGWFGRCMLEALHQTLGPAAFAERVRPYTSAGRTVTLRHGTQVATQRFDSLGDQHDDDSVLLHFAYLTKEQTAAMPLEVYLEANRNITSTVFSALEGLGCRALFMPSSGAVYRPDVSHKALTASNAYGKLKLEDEARALGWAAAAPGRRAVVCRVFNVSGPYINKYSDYVLSSAIDSALRDQPIRIRTPRRTLRSFVAVEELLSLVLAMLFDESRAAALFDTAGEEVLEIDELVEAVRQTLGRPVALDRPLRIDEEDRYLGDRAPYAALLAHYHLAPATLRDQILQTAAYIRQFPGP